MRKKIDLNIIILLCFGFVFRLVLAIVSKGFITDIHCFMDWADCVALNGGIENFYSMSGSDYTPGYVYILWLIGTLREMINFNEFPYVLMMLIMKLPAIICDIISSGIIYHIANTKLNEKKALIFTALYLFNPAIFLNSAMWGQVDSFIGLFMLLTVYFLYENKMFCCYLSFCIGILMKPQMAFLAPVILLGIIDNVFIKKFSLRKLLSNLAGGIVSLAISFLIILPFGVNEVFLQYTETVGSFKYGSVNAYNLWSMLGLNWESQDNLVLGVPAFVFGYLFIVLVYGLMFALWLRRVINKRKRRHFYYFFGAFSVIGIFTLSVRMHEKYMFPALILLLAFSIFANDIKSKILYVIMSIIHFVNVFHIYIGFDPLDYDWNNKEAVGFGAIMLICFAYMMVVWMMYLIKSNKLSNK